MSDISFLGQYCAGRKICAEDPKNNRKPCPANVAGDGRGGCIFQQPPDEWGKYPINKIIEQCKKEVDND